MGRLNAPSGRPVVAARRPMWRLCPAAALHFVLLRDLQCADNEGLHMTKLGEKILISYSTIASTALLVTVLAGAASQKIATFDELNVHRIDVVEPDGTLRLVISDAAELPGVIVKGKERPPADRPQAGLLFYNDEGSETGGLIFAGHKNAQGQVVDCCGSLSFDRYGANQFVQLAGVDDSTDQFAGLAVSDTKRRIWVGRTGDGVAAIVLRDGAGRKRVAIEAPASGSPAMEFFDDRGRVVQRVVPGSK
jgi:hypothetical protein